jgi:hypothetical protein
MAFNRSFDEFLSERERRKARLDKERLRNNLLEKHRRKVRSDLYSWCCHALQSAIHDDRPAAKEPARHHQLLIRELEAVARCETDRLMIWLPPGYAKALALDTPIPTPDGWKMMGQLRVGDQVFDEKGKICNVIVVSPIWRNRQVYRVTTNCGDEIIADEAHVWQVDMPGHHKVRKRKWVPDEKKKKPGTPRKPREYEPGYWIRLKTTKQIAGLNWNKFRIKRAEALQLPERDLSIDPYLLGLWLGDGNSGSAHITVADKELSWVQEELERLGYKTSALKPASMASRSAGVLLVPGLRKKLADLDLLYYPKTHNYGWKHIPDEYLRASYEQRVSLLQGLIDSDGTVGNSLAPRACNGYVSFCNTNRELAENVRELVRSLGLRAQWCEGPATLNGKVCGTAFRVGFLFERAARLPRKAALCRPRRNGHLIRVSATPAGRADTVCISVDSESHLFLAGRSMTPTHNSTYASILFPPWFLAQRSGLRIIGTSHGADLAETFSGKVRSLADEYSNDLGYTLTDRNVGMWRTSNFGEYRAAGVGGSITGRRADCILIDDPVKDRKEAESETTRNDVWDWYRGVVLQRLVPGGRIILIQTRWHLDDLSGRLVELSKAGGDKWRVIKLPAIADAIDDPLGRRIGEALWPEWEDEAALARKHGAMGDYEWGAQFQQDPQPAGASFFKLDDLLVFGKGAEYPIACEIVFTTIDSAMKSGSGHSGTGAMHWGWSPHFGIPLTLLDWDVVSVDGYLLHSWLDATFARGEELAQQCRARRGYVGALIEDKVSGTILLQQAQAQGKPAMAIDSKLTAMGKEERAFDASPYVAAGRAKFSQFAYDKTLEWEGSAKNHALTQVLGLRIGSKDVGARDLLDCFTYGVILGLGTQAGF